MAKKIALIKTAALLVVGVCAAALAVSAKANTVQFDVSGTLTQTLPFTNPPPTPFSGIMMIDVTVGTVTAADIAVQGFSKDFANLTSQAGVVGLPPLYQISLSDGVGDSLNLTFVAVAFDGPIDFDCTVVPFPMCMTGFLGSLIGFSGGTINGGSLDVLAPDFASGSISPTAIPLPTALPLFATGLGALGLLGWRRKQTAQAVA